MPPAQHRYDFEQYVRDALLEIKEGNDRVERAIFGDEEPGLKQDVASLMEWRAWVVKMFLLIFTPIAAVATPTMLYQNYSTSKAMEQLQKVQTQMVQPEKP